MSFASPNYLAVVAAAVAAFVFGGIWYGVLGKQWLAALGKTKEQMKATGLPMFMQLGITFVAQLVMAWVLAGVIGHLGAGQVNLANGLHAGFHAWVGFVAIVLIVNYSFQGQKRALYVIDGAHWLGALLIQGAVIGAFGS